jgi:hypothetical protein
MSRSWVAAPQDSEHDRTERDQKQVIGRNVLTEEIDRALEAGSAAAEQIARSPDQNHDVLHHQGEAERRQ